MANHLHKQIRDALKTALTGLTTTGAHVYANRLQPMTDANLPGLRISLDDETVEGLTIHHPQLQNRTLTLNVDCCAQATSALDDALDQISKEVEIALAAGITLGSKLLEVFYTGMQFTDEQGAVPVGVKSLKFSIPFTAMNNAPDVLS
jgi:hypothetical protein